MKLIDKDALVAEIERRRKLVSDPILSGNDLMIGERNAYFNLLSFLDTLEVKEVNLDGISRHYALNNSPWDDCRDEIQDAYKAGFELGMQVSNKAQKGE